jgi:hypothetical protein
MARLHLPDQLHALLVTVVFFLKHSIMAALFSGSIIISIVTNMTKQLNLRSSCIDPVAPRHKLGFTHILILIILVVFVGKQCVDVAQEWHKSSIKSAELNEANTALCLKEYNQKLCSQSSSPECKQLLTCLQQRPSLDFSHVFDLASQELCDDFWLPATIMGLLMLFRLTETAVKPAET